MAGRAGAGAVEPADFPRAVLPVVLLRALQPAGEPAAVHPARFHRDAADDPLGAGLRVRLYARFGDLGLCRAATYAGAGESRAGDARAAFFRRDPELGSVTPDPRHPLGRDLDAGFH